MLSALSALTSFNAGTPRSEQWKCKNSARRIRKRSNAAKQRGNSPPQRFVVTGAEARQCQLPSALLTRRRLIVGLAPSVVQWKPMLCAVESQTTCGAAYDCEFRLAPSTTAGLPGNNRPISETEEHLQN